MGNLNVTLLKDAVTKRFAVFLYIIADFLCIIISIGDPLYGKMDGSIKIVALLILAVYNIFAFFIS